VKRESIYFIVESVSQSIQTICICSSQLNFPGSSKLNFTMAPAAISPPSSPGLTNATPSSDISAYRGYHHVHWYVGNAKQAASFYVSRMGFERVAYRGLETGSRVTASHVVRNGNVTFVLTSPLRCLEQSTRFSKEDAQLLRDIHEHQEKHGDAVKGTAESISRIEHILSIS
jgi:4-hydroxyphenylpyruvate dioxygenase